MLIAVLSGFVLALVAPSLHRRFAGASNWLLALLPLGLCIYFSRWIQPVAAGEVFRFDYPWVPSLAIRLTFFVDGLSLVFALLISLIGALIIIYAGGYLSGHPHLGRLYAFLFIFMGSMLGLVLADNVVTFFVFWELTSFSSYLLIGFDAHRAEARYSALQALLVTGLGGLAMLAGLVLMALAGGSWEISVLLAEGELLRGHPYYVPIALLLLLGAFTKSAQFPFHFWLPNAMEAPTPVSAYLHSATMVKAGVYLIARFDATLSSELWSGLVIGLGGLTMLVGAWLAFRQSDLKRILAYSTVSALGTLVFLIGIGDSLGAKAAMTFLVVHSLYKGALFLVAGALDHETGTRNVERLGGLRQLMPLTALAAGLAALSMAGVPPLLGFISKEIFYETTLEAGFLPFLLTGLVFAANSLVVGIALLLAVKPFFGPLGSTPKKPHEAPLSLLTGPLLLAFMGLLFGLFSGPVGRLLIAPAAAATLRAPAEVSLSLWHGFNLVLLLSALTLAAGVWAYRVRTGVLGRLEPLSQLGSLGPDRGYAVALDGLNAVAGLQTRWLQSGYLRYYLLTIILTTVALVYTTLFRKVEGLPEPLTLGDAYFYEIVIAVLMLASALAAVTSQSRLGAVAALSVVGFGVALTFLLFSAPDLAMTQFLVETLTLILLILVFYHLPRFSAMSRPIERMKSAVVALAVGSMMGGLLLIVIHQGPYATVSEYFVLNSVAAAHGRNIVNVILVDFRGLDTLGEITVLALAGVGVYALLKLRLGEREREKR